MIPLVKEKIDVIKINTWESDFCNEPLIPIVDKLITLDSFNNEKNAIKDTFYNIVEQFSVNYIKNNTGINVDEFKGKNLCEEFTKKLEEITNLNNILKGEYSPTKPLFILIDELDRCKPDYAVKFLERIKHIFKTKGIIFILGVDRHHLQRSVECLFGSIDFSEYYRKFVQRNIPLPTPSEELLGKYLEYKMSEQAKLIKNTQSLLQLQYQYNLTDLIKSFKLSLRQINEFFYIIRHTLTINKNYRIAVTQEAIIMATYILTLIEIKDSTFASTDNLSFENYVEKFTEWELDQYCYSVLLCFFYTEENKKLLEGKNIECSEIKIVNPEGVFSSAHKRIQECQNFFNEQK